MEAFLKRNQGSVQDLDRSQILGVLDKSSDISNVVYTRRQKPIRLAWEYTEYKNSILKA